MENKIAKNLQTEKLNVVIDILIESETGLSNLVGLEGFLNYSLNVFRRWL